MRDPLYWMPIRYKLTLAFVVLSLAAFGIGAIFVSHFARDALEREIALRLETSASADAEALESALMLLGRRTQDFASDGLIRGLLRDATDGDQAGAAQRLSEHLALNKVPLEAAFVDCQVLDPSGKVVAAGVGVDVLGRLSRIEHETFDLPAFSGVADLDGHLTLIIATPVRSLDGSTDLGRLIAVVDVATWLMASGLQAATEEDDPQLVVIDPAGRRVAVPWWLRGASKRSTEHDPLSILPDLQGGVAARQRNRKSVAQGIGATGWRAESTIDAGIAMAPVRALQSRYIGAGLLAAAFLVVGLSVVLKFLILPLSRMRSMATQMAGGDLAARVDVESEDEIGDLARALNSMADAVAERTARSESERNRLEAVVSSMEDGLVMLDDRGDVVLSNSAARPLLDTLRGRGASPSPRDCPSCDGVDDRDCGSCISEGSSGSLDCIIDIGKKTFDLVETRISATEGRGEGRVIVARDITERMLMNDRQAHQERMSVLGEVTAVVAHEVNNPLAAIAMFNQMLADGLDESSPFQENVEVIARNTETCKRAISDLLDNVRSGPPEIEAVDLTDILRDVVRFLAPFAKRGEVDFEIVGRPQKSEVVGDEIQLRQVFVNLVMNAIQAMSGNGGRVLLRLGDASVNETEMIQVDVEDTGPGVPADAVEHIFDPFYTTKSSRRGTGLGLPTSRRTIETHGGQLELLHTGSSGTTFRVSLPVAHQAVDSSSDAQKETPI